VFELFTNNKRRKTMKKIYSLLAAALVTGFCSVPALAGQSYISGDVGSSWMNDTKDGAFKYGMNSGVHALGALGMRENCYRFEGELGYQRNDVDKLYGPFGTSNYDGKIEVWSALANAYYDIYTGGGVKPYLTAGVGAARVQFEYLRFPGAPQSIGWSEHDSVFAYQLGAGVAFPISKGVKLDARYRYFSTAEFTLDNGNQSRLSSSSVLLGLRFGL
jgi:opacity protein-like surface antigen